MRNELTMASRWLRPREPPAEHHQAAALPLDAWRTAHLCDPTAGCLKGYAPAPWAQLPGLLSRDVASQHAVLRGLQPQAATWRVQPHRQQAPSWPRRVVGGVPQAGRPGSQSVQRLVEG